MLCKEPLLLLPKLSVPQISARRDQRAEVISFCQHIATREVFNQRRPCQVERSADRTRDCCLSADPSDRPGNSPQPAKRATSLSCFSPASPETGPRRRLCSAKSYLASWRLSAHTGANERRSKVIAGRFYDASGRLRAHRFSAVASGSNTAAQGLLVPIKTMKCLR